MAPLSNMHVAIHLKKEEACNSRIKEIENSLYDFCRRSKCYISISSKISIECIHLTLSLVSNISQFINVSNHHICYIATLDMEAVNGDAKV